METLTADRWLGAPEAARMIGVHRNTLWAWGDQGQGPKFTLIGCHRKYWVSDVQAWLDSRPTGGEGAGDG